MNSIVVLLSGATCSAFFSDRVTQRLGERGEVADADPSLVQLSGHRRRVADVGERAQDEHAIEAGDHATDGVRIRSHSVR
jgi:hypothetical protein